MGLPEHWIYQGSRDEQLAEAGISVDNLTRVLRFVMDGQEVPVVITDPLHATT